MFPWARRQMRQQARAQVQTVEIAHGHLPSIMPCVMRRGLAPVAVGGEDFITGQLRDSGEPSMKRRACAGEQHAMHVTQNVSPARAVQSGEVVGMAGRVLETHAVFL